MLNRVVELSNDYRLIDITEVNNQVKNLNALIDKYNRAQPVAKQELLLEIYYAHRLLDAKIQSLALMHSSKVEEYSEKLHETFVDELKAEFREINIQPFHERVINAWDIQNIKSDEGIPTAMRFAKMTRPGYWARLLGETPSLAVQTVMRLMADISQSSLKENTKENYHKLSTLKASIREVLADSTLSTDDQAVLRGLILTLNGRIADILENNPVLQREIEPPVFPFADSVANASYKDLQAMTTVLEDRANFTSDAFHLAFDDLFPGLEDYTVIYLGGANAKNYLLTDAVTQQQYVLKISPEMGSNRQTAERLKNTAVSNNLAQVYASRDRMLTEVRGMGKHYTLEITEYCARGDVLAYGSTMVTDEDKLASAWSIYSQMTDTLMHFGSNNALFPDMKPVNFLVNEDGKLVIADTKSFVDTSNGIFNFDKVNEKQFYLYTAGIQPPEFETTPTTEVDKHHAYLMGLSLFLYLTNQGIDVIGPAQVNGFIQPAFYDFNAYPIFQTLKGQQYQQLITGLVDQDPVQRYSLTQAKQDLQLIQQGIKLQESSFKSKPEAYFYAIHHLTGLQASYPNNLMINMATDMLKILVENHEQNTDLAAGILETLAIELHATIIDDQQAELNAIAHAIKTSAYQQTLQEKYENPLARRFESRMQIELLQNPTTAMMASVNQVSAGLLNVAAQMEEQGYTQDMEYFAADLTSGINQTGFGSQPQAIDLSQMKDILTQNRPQDLNQILFIQFLFAQKQMRILPESILAPNNREPKGKLLEIIKEYNYGEYADNPATFFDVMDTQKLKLISDVKIYGSPLFSAELGRGRQGGLVNQQSSQMGLMLLTQTENQLPVDPSSWTPDAKYQGANLDSIYVRDLIENDAVYSAGPSGMTSLFMGIMETYGNLSSVNDKQNYLSAVSAYMVSGGLHSLHEVIGPAQYALDLVPGYQVTPPQKDTLAKPPNFHQFYQQQMAIDPEFRAVYKSGWDKLIADYDREHHLYLHRPIARTDSTPMVQQVASQHLPKTDLKLNDAKAANQLIDVLHTAATAYADYTNTHSARTHGSSGIDRVVTLVEKSRMHHSLAQVMQQVNAYFDNRITSLSGTEFSNKSRANNYSFISFLLNELKTQPDLVAFINKKNTSGQPLVLSIHTDYTQSDALADRTTSFEALRIIAVAEEPLDLELSCGDKLKQFKDELVELRYVEGDGDGEHQALN